MKNESLLNRLGFSDNDLEHKSLSFPHNDHLHNESIIYYGKGNSEQAKTRFYWVQADSMPLADIKIIHERIWNENEADLLFLEKANVLEIKYISTSPKQDLLEIVSIPTNVADTELLDKISKEHITTGAFWIAYKDALDRIKSQHKTVDQSLVESLTALRVALHAIYSKSFPDKNSAKIVQALIDRTLFIKFLEDKKIINSVFYQKYFGDKDIHYKDLLQQKEARRINELFERINKLFNNKLFDTPTIVDSDLLDTALMAIADTISGTKDGQLCLFDFQFDIIPIEFISHIYQIFLDDKKAKQGIFYTPTGLANLLLDKVITNEGSVLDPSCGSGIFLVLAFRKMYVPPASITDVYEKIQDRLAFIKKNIFGIELENTAARLALFSLYLEVLNGITPYELNQLISNIILVDAGIPLFTIDFSSNIQECNALVEGNESPFLGKYFKYIIGNPPWFSIGKNGNGQDNKINYTYWDKYRTSFSSERQISQCFLHRIKFWSTDDTKFGFIVNSSNFTNEFDNFQKFMFSTYRFEYYFELHHVKEILFEYAKEPACMLVFDTNASATNTIAYLLPKLNSFSERFKTILLHKDDGLTINQHDLLDQQTSLRDYLIGTLPELSLANKLEQECGTLNSLLLIDKKYKSKRGFGDWGEDALKNEYGKEKSTLSTEEYGRYKVAFLSKYFSKLKSTEHSIPFIKSAQLDKFHIDHIDTFCKENISNFDRQRESFIYTGDKILCTRIGGELKATYTGEKIYFGTDIYIIKLLDSQLYHAVTCCLNSELLDYFSQVKLRKRIDSALSRLNTSDLEKLPMPKKFNQIIVDQLTDLSKGISAGLYSFKEKERELNELVFDLYELDYIERQRVSDFFISQNQSVTKKMFEDYCEVFFKTFRSVLKTGIVKMEYSYNPNTCFDIAGVQITFGENKASLPKIDQVQRFLNHQMLQQLGNSVLISMKERIYTADSIFIIKDVNPKSWTKSAAYDDARMEIKKLMRR